MKIQTKYLGEVEIDKSKILSFPQGLLGFVDSTEFVLLDIHEDRNFRFLQDIHNSQISFLLVNPWDFYSDYDVELADEELKKINIDPKGENEIGIFTIVTLGKTFKESTANLLAPIVMNLSNQKGKQFILNESKYMTRHKLFPEGIGEWYVNIK